MVVDRLSGAVGAAQYSRGLRMYRGHNVVTAGARWCPAIEEAHNIAALLSCRKALLDKTIDLANEVHGVLKVFRLRLQNTVQHGSFDGLYPRLMTAPPFRAGKHALPGSGR